MVCENSMELDMSSYSSFERVFTIHTAWPHWTSGQVLSSQLIVSSSRTVRPCSPWGGRWIGHWMTTWSTVCSSAPHSQAAEEVIPHLGHPHLCKQERKCPTPVRRQLSRGPTLFLEGPFQVGGYRCRGGKYGIL